MKRSKLLFVTPCIALTALPITSCGENKGILTIEDVEKAIFKPCNDETIKEDTFIDCLAQLNDKDRKTELLYSMYAPLFYVPNGYQPFTDVSLKDLWEDGFFAMSSNISKCSLTIKENQAYASYVGYVTLIFVKDWNDSFKKNDYLQFTLILDNEKVTPLEQSKWQLHFDNKNPEYDIPYCWGIVQVRQYDTTQTFYLNYLGWVDGQSFGDFPPNWHNWKSA